MAVGKMDVVELTPGQLAIAASAETIIDKELKNYVKGSIVHVDCSKLGLVTYNPAADPRIREEIIKRYQDAGWTVTYHYDQRDGSWLDFS